MESHGVENAAARRAGSEVGGKREGGCDWRRRGGHCLMDDQYVLDNLQAAEGILAGLRKGAVPRLPDNDSATLRAGERTEYM